MAAIEVKYTFAEKVSGAVLITIEEVPQDLDSPMWEDDVIALLWTKVMEDLSTGVKLTNDESVLHWARSKLEESRG